MSDKENISDEMLISLMNSDYKGALAAATNPDTDGIIKWNIERTGKQQTELVNRLRMSGLSEKNILTVLKTLDVICNVCWDGGPNCYCQNDE